MPWPFLPPNPDTQPAPFDGDLFVFSLELTGMDPPTEQYEHRFTLDGVTAGVYVPIQQSASEHAYAGVGIAPLTRVGSTVQYKCIYLPRGKDRSHSIDVDARQLRGGVSNIEVSRSGSKAIIKAHVDVPGSGWTLFAVPFASKMPKFSSLGAYQALLGHTSLSGSGTVKVTVRSDDVEQYAVFVGQGWPTKITPGSGAHLVKL